MTLSELKPYGVEEMAPEAIERYLEARSMGVLGLPSSDGPYLLPLSYAYDGDSSLYFTYVVGKESKKERLTRQAASAPFLIYSAETMFHWQSVLLDGTFDAVPPSDWGEIAEILEGSWRPEVFKTARTERHVKIYRYDITEQFGIRHAGLSPRAE